ncbi:Starch-binding associating with outer membrane [Flavobacterium aquidurense]|uniref:RagB/SusD family nutrient uptake outer membrane protein n=1 Tax=Flavobacterium frigidimaris TaxID=262320 RepID=A0ABX4BSJ4_FLAFR|nr:RagB/SusD family nutrient uptake outer membrane protein [Flavobacterium frigidimaris]OXA80380.1 RagB/SusD family nutrient uptake outer membrane protein [Flavobacterium frigidimaris]SDY74936.1 Starch-binding associating with outer membrane [Flavobacterium aquidurense]
MKKIYILLTAISLGLAACTGLSEDPESFISPGQFYKTSNDAVAAVNSIYFHLNQNDIVGQPIYNSLYNTGMDFMTDDLSAGPGSPNPDVRSLSALAHSSTLLRGKESWQQHYSGINKANVAIERIPEVTMDEKLKSRLLGEARFLRALYYFDLVRQFGGVPLLLTDQTQLPIEQLQVPRNTATEIYAQIITDLKESVNNFKAGSTGEVGRATEGAAKSLLSKVYLTKRDWANAVTTAEEVINGSYGYVLLSDYSQVFLPAYKNSKEHIFSVQFNSAANITNAVTGRDIATGVPGIKGSYGDQLTFYTKGTDKFFSIYKLYTAKDKRRNVSFVTKYKSPTNGKWYGTLNDIKIPGDSVPYLNKYWDPNFASTGKSEANANIIRFAEVLLIHAEAENELNGPTAKAYASLNRVRKRAGLDDLTPDLTKDQFREALYLDRRLELVGEYQRFFDLIRQTGSEATGVGPEGRGTLLKNLQAVGKTNVAARHYLFPIPQFEIERNKKLTQNPGWE